MGNVNGKIFEQNTRFRLTVYITRAITALFILSLIVDITNGIAPYFKGGSVNIVLGDTTLLLLGAFLTRWSSAWESYFNVKANEDKDMAVKDALDSKGQ